MAKKGKASGTTVASAAPAPVPVAKQPAVPVDTLEERVAAHKARAVRLFLDGEHAKALVANDEGLQALNEAGQEGSRGTGGPQRVDLLLNKVSNYIKLNRYKEAIVACTSALEVQPNSPKALRWRAQALEQEGHLAAALTDIQAVNASVLATATSKDVEKRLKERIANPPPAPAAPPAGQRPAPQQQQPRPERDQTFFFTAKVTLGRETRVVSIPSSGISYADLLQSVRATFPASGPVILKFEDKEKDTISITCKNDIDRALQELITDFKAKFLASKDREKAGMPSLPSLRLQAVPVATEAEVPKPPAEELQAQEQLLRAMQARMALQQEEAAAAAGAQQTVELDDWLVDFANMFRDMTGIDADRHVDMHNLGWDKCTRAMEATLANEKALPLFDQAAEKFREVTCAGLLSWGNVSMCLGHRLLDEAGQSGASLESVRDGVLAEFDKAETRYNQAMAYKADFFDGACALGQLAFERAKLRAGLLVALTKSTPAAAASPEEGATTAETTDASEAAAVTAASAAVLAALIAGLAKLKKEDVDVAQGLFQQSSDWFGKALAMDPDGARKREAAVDAAAEDKAEAAPAEEAASTPADAPQRCQGLIMQGNCQYEWSQILAAVCPRTEWQPVLDAASDLFRAAGCVDNDIRNALKNHSQAAELDLGPDPEPEVAPAAAEEAAAEPAAKAAPAPVAAAAPAEAKKEAKGLPALAARKK